MAETSPVRQVQAVLDSVAATDWSPAMEGDSTLASRDNSSQARSASEIEQKIEVLDVRLNVYI